MLLTQEIKKDDALREEGGEDLENLILKLLQGESLSADTLAHLTGSSPQAVDRRLKRLRKFHEIEVVTVRKVFYWGVRRGEHG